MLENRLLGLAASGNFHGFFKVRLHEQHKLIARDSRTAHASSSNLVRRSLQQATGMNLESLTNLEGHAILGDSYSNNLTVTGHRIQPSGRVFGNRDL